MKEIFEHIIVVEGNHDKARILQVFPDAEVMITNGREISLETLNALKTLNETRGLILMTDPDVPGETIRKRINDYVGETHHVFLNKQICIDESKGKVGIEYAPDSAIRQGLLNHLHHSDKTSNVSKKALLRRGLLGGKNARALREKVCDAYNLGLSNGKTFHKKINMFNVTLPMIDAVIE